TTKRPSKYSNIGTLKNPPFSKKIYVIIRDPTTRYWNRTGHANGSKIEGHLDRRRGIQHVNRLVPVDNSLIFINFMNRLRAKRTDSLTNRF
ncbi:MAG: hypothetical protein, partial [Olavius algarvensis Gamma 1 endosymbiont]